MTHSTGCTDAAGLPQAPVLRRRTHRPDLHTRPIALQSAFVLLICVRHYMYYLIPYRVVCNAGVLLKKWRSLCATQRLLCGATTMFRPM